VPGDAFDRAYSEFERARAEFLKAAPEPKQFELSTEAHELMSLASDAMDEMMRIEAPTVFALFQKLRAISECAWPWSIGDYRDRLTADADTLTLQFAKVWLEKWRERGGSVLADGDGVSIFIPEFSLSPDAAALKQRQGAAGYQLSDDQRGWHAAFYDGAMREMVDLIERMPGARNALKAIIAENPAAGLGALDSPAEEESR
jgi:hypothetical protein